MEKLLASYSTYVIWIIKPFKVSFVPVTFVIISKLLLRSHGVKSE